MPDTTDDLLGGRYRLGETLGRGGMADVFRGEDVVLGREVAIKIVRSGADGVAADSRARGEVSVLAALNHPSLVTLYDAQLDADPPYLVMELVEGPTLTTRIARSPLTPPAAAMMAADLGEALHVAHGAGVVHRDVKPSNVLLAPSHLPDHEFRAKLADFGIAYLVDTARVTNPGEVIGTAAYLAPEQVRGVDPAPPADVYALGLVLIEALTGSRAFPDAAGVATALARLEAPPEIPAGLDPEWRELLTDMTRIEPGERPTALDVAMRARSLAAVTSDAPTEALAAGGAVAAGAVGAGIAAGTVRDASADAHGDAVASDAATEALLPAASGAVSPPVTAPTSVLSAASDAEPGATRAVGPAPASPTPAAGASAARRNRRRPRRRAAIWVTAAAAAALVAGAGGILALTAGGDEGTPADPAPVTDPTPGVSPTAPADEEDTAEEVDTVSDTGTTEEQETTPTPEETTNASDDEATPDDGTTAPPEDTGTTDGSDQGVTEDGATEGGGTDPAEPSPAPTDDAVTEPDPADSPVPEAPSPAPTG